MITTIMVLMDSMFPQQKKILCLKPNDFQRLKFKTQTSDCFSFGGFEAVDTRDLTKHETTVPFPSVPMDWYGEQKPTIRSLVCHLADGIEVPANISTHYKIAIEMN